MCLKLCPLELGVMDPEAGERLFALLRSIDSGL